MNIHRTSSFQHKKGSATDGKNLQQSQDMKENKSNRRCYFYSLLKTTFPKNNNKKNSSVAWKSGRQRSTVIVRTVTDFRSL